MLSTDRCKSCGGGVEINASLGIGVCQYCGSKQPLSAEDINVMNNAQKAQRIQNIPDSAAAKKHRKKIIIPIIIITLIIYAVIFITGMNGADKISVSDAHMTTALDANYKAVDTVDKFSKNADKLIYVATVNGITENVNVKIVWHYGSTIINTTNVELTKEKNRLYAYITPTKKPWAIGAYYVELYIDNDTNPINSSFFNVN
ncbi:MAG: hypothetical protein GYA50_08520 [Eubacteriaceae bacterium]|nr:hypothetical protein [Eubacteriaceae bacterium]